MIAETVPPFSTLAQDAAQAKRDEGTRDYGHIPALVKWIPAPSLRPTGV